MDSKVMRTGRNLLLASEAFLNTRRRSTLFAAQLNLRRIVGRAMKENRASIKVLEKIGLVYEQDAIFEGMEAVIYKIEK